MTNRGKSSTHRQANNNTNNNNKSQNDDDNCSVICYKDSHDGHVGVIRIRQQPVCPACNILRGTLASYYKHIVDKTHRESVKKLCDENRFVPSVYDQAIHLAFQNNFYYQSEKFHFLYKHADEESNSPSEQIEPSETEQMDINNEQNQQKSTPRKRRNLRVILVFQDKTYSQIGVANAQIREQLLKKMLEDRAADLAALPMEIYYTNKKIAPEDIHHNAQQGSVVIPTIKDQSQMMLKEQQDEPFENGQMSSAENSSEDHGAEQTTAMSTHEISTAETVDQNEQSSSVDDIVCKTVMNDLLRDVCSKSDECKREQRFLAGLARRSFRKKNTLFCDLCNKFLPTEKQGALHLTTSEHQEKVLHYDTTFLPWRRAMQKSLISGKSMKEIMDQETYDKYKATMALHLTPNILCNRGRFCCAYCEMIFTDQWSLEKHLYSPEHGQKQTSEDHKDLVVRYANSVNFPIIFKFNGITHLSEIPDDIKTRYQWRNVTRAQLDDDVNSFSRNYPFDACEGATRLLSGRAARKQKSFPGKPAVQNSKNNNNNNLQGRRGGFNHGRGGQFQTTAPRRGTVNKRPYPVAAPPTKRFRVDLNNSFPGANRGPGPVRNYNMEQYEYNRSGPYNNGNNQWHPQHPPNDQQYHQRREFFDQPNNEFRSLASNNNGHFNDRASYPTSGGNNFNHNRPAHFNGAGREYNNQPPNYDRNFIHNAPQARADYHREQHPSPPAHLHNHPHHPSHSGPINEPVRHIPNNFPPAQQQRPLMGPMHHQNSFSDYGARNNNNNNNNNNNHNNNNNNSPFFSSPINQQANPMGANNPSIHPYSNYRPQSALLSNNNPSPVYSPLANNANPAIPQGRTFDEFGLGPLANHSTNSYSRPAGPSFRNNEPHYSNFGHQNQMEPAPQTSWRGTSRGGNSTRGRGGTASSFQSAKQPGATFSYSSSSNKNNNFSMRGRGVGQNGRNFGGGR